MLSWSIYSLIADGRSQSEIRQGSHHQIFGEGSSMGPLNAEMKKRMIARRVTSNRSSWTTLADVSDLHGEAGAHLTLPLLLVQAQFALTS